MERRSAFFAEISGLPKTYDIGAIRKLDLVELKWFGEF
jgi:hypothetical protein